MNRTSRIAVFLLILSILPTLPTAWAAGNGKTYSVGNAPSCVAVGDFNGDGFPDLVTANFYSTNISLLFGQADGGFHPAVNFPVGVNPYFVLVADFNHDNHQDLAVSDYARGIYILLGNGDRTFQPPVHYHAGFSPEGMVAADFNRDGNLDLAVANFSGSNLSILRGNGDGTFTRPVDYATASGPNYIAAADVDGDGILDLMTSNGSGPEDAASLLLGNGDGTFQPAIEYGANLAANGIVLADFNQDGLPDVVLALYLNNELGIALGGSQTVDEFTTGKDPLALATADLNADGKLDLVAADFGANAISIIYGNGDGTFQPPIHLYAGKGPRYIALLTLQGRLAAAVADLNGDDVFVLPLQ